MGETTLEETGSADKKASSSEADATREEVVHEWAGSTSIHGLGLIFDVNSFRWKRLLLTFFFFVCLGLLCWNMAVILKNYFKYETSTSIQTVAPTSLDFPDVTVCNANPFQASLVEQTGIVAPKNDEELNLIAQPLEEFIFASSFSGEDLVVSENWTQIITDFGPCWTFHTDKKIDLPGVGDGLDFFVFLNRDDYYNESSVEGIYFFVTPPNQTMLTVYDSFTDLGAGVVHTVFLDVTKIQREKDHPWSSCVKVPVEYRQATCLAGCRFDNDIKSCGCRPLGDNRPESLEFDYCESSFPFSDDDDGGMCADLPDSEFEPCECPDPPCVETIYGNKVTTIPFSKTLFDSVANSTGISAEDLRSNIIYVTMNFDSIREQDVTESKSISRSGLLAAIGGLLGFFLGISVFSFVETLDLCFLRLLPRRWGDRRLYGIGSRADEGEQPVADSKGQSLEEGQTNDGGGIDSGVGDES